MLSKILREDQKESAQPLPWKRSGGGTTTAPVIAVATPKPMVAAPVIMHRTDGGHFAPESALQDQIHALERKLVETEQAAQRREQEARQAGYKEGETAARNQVQPVVDKLAQSIAEIGALRPKLRHEAEGDVIKLAIAIARKVLHRELQTDTEALSALVRFAMEKIRVHELVRVRVHPLHQAPIQQVLTRVMMGAHVELQADPRLPMGGILIETTRGDYDASVETQLREIEHGLTDKLLQGKR